MTTNIDRATEVIQKKLGVMTLSAEDTARRLADAGLLMPDLPADHAEGPPVQTHEWEELLDGTAVGPWEAEQHGNEPVMSICTTVHDPKRFVGDIYGEGNARLAAHAPAAVAEVIRLRKAIAVLEAEERATAEDEFFPDHLRSLFRAYADDLAHILEGDNHE